MSGRKGSRDVSIQARGQSARERMSSLVSAASLIPEAVSKRALELVGLDSLP